jgi:hypothetical protein
MSSGISERYLKRIRTVSPVTVSVGLAIFSTLDGRIVVDFSFSCTFEIKYLSTEEHGRNITTTELDDFLHLRKGCSGCINGLWQGRLFSIRLDLTKTHE